MSILDESFEVGGAKIPVIAVVIGGAVVILLLVIGKGQGTTTQTDTSGLLAEELNQRLQEQQASTEAALSSITDRLSASQARLETELRMGQQATQQAITASQAQQFNFGDALQAIQDQITSLVARLQGQTSTTQPATGPLPSASEIESWANGIRLPVEWGQAFVSQFGHLPTNLSELNTWMQQVATHPNGQTCIAGKCI